MDQIAALLSDPTFITLLCGAAAAIVRVLIAVRLERLRAAPAELVSPV
jgi:hypothetical protein